MSTPCIAVSGLHRGENPQPGAGILRSLRLVHPDACFVGLVYDIQESGIYAAGGPDHVHLMPYPSAGREALLERLDAIQDETPIDIYIPSLDAEIELLVHLPEELEARGIRACLPDRAMLRRRAKAFLPELAKTCGIAVPETRIAHDLYSLRAAARDLTYPIMVKGAYYDARRVQNAIQAQYAAAKLFSQWGAPVILQQCVPGSEFNVLGLGDGQGGVLGMCSIRKTALSDTGKGLGGIVVDDEPLARLARRLIHELRWTGPFEIELIRDEQAGRYLLIEINPRFPAWIDFPTQIGTNFPAALVQWLLDGSPETPLPPCAPGTFFLRHQIEVVGDVSRYGELLGAEASVRAATSPLPENSNGFTHEPVILSSPAGPAPRVGAV